MGGDRGCGGMVFSRDVVMLNAHWCHGQKRLYSLMPLKGVLNLNRGEVLGRGDSPWVWGYGWACMGVGLQSGRGLR